MDKIPRNLLILVSLILLLVLIFACSGAKPAVVSTATSIPTLVPPTVTSTPQPTSTYYPTGTPNIEATQTYNDLYDEITEYKDKGYISSMEGSYKLLGDFSKSWAQIGWYQWWPKNMSVTNFVYSGHFSWSAASQTPEISGCGIVFAIQANRDHYAVFLDKTRILFLHALSTSQYSNEVGKTRGSGRVSISTPYNADFSLIVNGYHSYVYVNKVFTGEYTLSTDSIMKGGFGYTLYSGTNKDYGTKCEITNSRLWIFE